jgi:hypothetical protein
MDPVAKLDQVAAAARQMAAAARQMAGVAACVTQAFEDAGFSRDEALGFAHHILAEMSL